MMSTRKYAKLVLDARVAAVRPATPEESDGEPGWVVVELADGYRLEGSTKFIAYSVPDARKLLSKLTHTPAS